MQGMCPMEWKSEGVKHLSIIAKFKTIDASRLNPRRYFLWVPRLSHNIPTRLSSREIALMAGTLLPRGIACVFLDFELSN